MENETTFSIEPGFAADGSARYCIKVQTANIEMNVLMLAEELDLLTRIREADWSQRKSIRAGAIGPLAVSWCADEEHMTILAGSDDETWDIAVSIPADSINRLLFELASVPYPIVPTT
ncbi:MAG: hypothetical protein FWC42_00325 [Proteobacteria bacterium]|nr:hypothetical protein [Pseudomonadota bacterium]